ncbi:MAG: GNAT family N-acetyltransferase [Deltaproteobacteria bacterium]|nr:GNAT family N-acetyltransferase [Deltaproteobacteria bacterium]
MNSARFPDLLIRPLREEDTAEVEQLFARYPYKDFQLKQLEIPKEKMIAFLARTLKGELSWSACLREEGRLVGLMSARDLPWMSQLIGARMFSLQHFLTDNKSPGYYQTMLRYFLDQMNEVDFLSCRVASGDINAIQALENSGFRFVGNEVNLIRSFAESPVGEEYNRPDCLPCPQDLQGSVMGLVEKTHVHNRYMYDPEVSAETAAEIFSKYLSGFAFKEGFRSRIMLEGGKVTGFIFYKFNTALSDLVGGLYASLDFIGVDRSAQNRGTGEILNQAALYDLAASGATHCVVRTFGSNYPAIRICHKVGFKITSSDLHFHHWLRPTAKAEPMLHSSEEPFLGAKTADR